jgi:Tfp pilus assembly protein PilF
MKISSKIAVAMLGMVFMGSAVKAQSLDDARKAIDAEQYQKAKTMLKNLTVTEASKDENYFYLGWVYILQDYPDSATAIFQKGIAVNPKSALNYVGLGAVAHVNKDAATATTNFNQALALAKKDTRPYTYVGKAYLLDPVDANSALTVLANGKAISAKDPELLITIGDAYRSQLKSTDAYNNYEDAITLDANSTVADVALGVLWKFANNFDGAEEQFQAAIKIDPNFGPAYREWAETDLRWANSDPKMSAKKVEAVDHYKKYISLTDMSVESQMRYADFLISAHDPADYQTLEQVATQLSKSANTNLRVYRYLGYAAYENKDYPAGLTALNTWMTKADPKRIIPEDYLYLGRLQVATNQDSLGIITLNKAYALDTTQTVVLQEIAKAYYREKKYKIAGDEYGLYIDKSKQGSLTDYFAQGRSYYFAYDPKNPKPDTALLTEADSAFSRLQQKATSPVAIAALYQAYVNDLKETDRNNIKGLAKPYYEQFITLTTAKPTLTDSDKKLLASAYDYLGRYYAYQVKDDAKATDNYTKAAADDPTDQEAAAFLTKHK